MACVSSSLTVRTKRAIQQWIALFSLSLRYDDQGNLLGIVQGSSAGAAGVVGVLLACLGYLLALGVFAGRSSGKANAAQN